MIRKILLAAAFAATASMAQAHSEKDGSLPADGAILDAAPAAIELRFKDGIRLTKVEVTHTQTGASALDLSDQTGFEKAFSLPMTPAGSGVYMIEWRGLGVDGHPMTGSFSFEVK